MVSDLLFMLFLCGLAIGANAKYSFPPGPFCKSCPPDWTWFGGRCYKFEECLKDWADAEKHCNSCGGNLASLGSTDEYTFIRELIYTPGSNKKCWVGGYDAPKNGVWLWSDGSNFNFNSWGLGQPDNNEKDNCMNINMNGVDFVADDCCSKKMSYVCAKAL